MLSQLISSVRGLAKSSLLLKSFYTDIYEQYKSLFLLLEDYRYYKKIQNNLSCKVKTIKDFYNHLGYFHLEFLGSSIYDPKKNIKLFHNNGMLLSSCNLLEKFFPNITVADINLDLFKKFEMHLNTFLGKLNFHEVDIHNNKFSSQIKFNSVSLQFVLDKISGLSNIEEFILSIKSCLDPYNSVIFGTTVIGGSGLKHTNKAKLFINNLNQTKFWHNQNTNLVDLQSIFEKHFDNIKLSYEGSCLFFVLQTKQEKIKLHPLLPADNPLKMPFV